MNSNAASRRYLRAVRQLLPGSRKMKNEIMALICSSVDDYLEQSPDADIDQITDRFGAPQSVAVACLDNVDTKILLKDLHVRRRIVAAVMAILLTMLILWSGVIVWAIIKENNSVYVNGTVKTTIVTTDVE